MGELGNISKTALKTNELDVAKGHCRVNEWSSTEAVLKEYGKVFPDIYLIR